MKVNRLLPGLAFVGFLAASSADAQFVHLSRCHAAYPCLIPFGLQYNPDALIAGPYAQVPTTAFSGRIELKTPIKIEIDKPIDQKAIDEAVRRTLEVRGSEKTPTAAPPAPAATPPAAETSKPGNPPSEN